MDLRSSKGTLLIVDDEIEIGQLLSDAISYMGYNTVIATNGEEALLAFCTGDIQAVLCDILMPKMTGIDLLNVTRTMGFDVPFVFLSAFDKQEYMNEVFLQGAEEYILKPLDMAKIVPSVERAIAIGKKKAAPIAA
jgi:YesN/AraC family two-component response regulator